MARKIPPSAARPAPFTPEQVAALVAWEANTAEVGKLLAAHRQPRLPSPATTRRPKTGTSPIPLSAADLRELATGRVPEAVQARLASRPPTTRARTASRRTSGARPMRRLR